MLDSVVQAYLTRDDPRSSSGTFGERATALVRSYKVDLDRNRSALHELRRELSSREHRLTDVRILDLLIWSVSAPTEGRFSQGRRPPDRWYHAADWRRKLPGRCRSRV